jgi:hypothetical protein
MKNTIKMSLVAAIAVAGFSTAASAGSLEEAIKGVSIKGKMEVEYDWEKSNAGTPGATDATNDSWDLDWDVTAKIPVNDNITAVFGAEGDTDTNTKDEQITGKGNVQVTKVYFQYANGPLTVLVGKQSIGAPWFDDERADGVKALYNAGPVTLAAAHFTGTNANANGAIDLEDTQISAAAAIGSLGPVNVQVWYAELAGITPTIDADSIIVMADAKFDIVNVSAKYGTAEYDGLGSGVDDDAEMLQIIASADFGVAAPYIGYGATDSEQAAAGLDLTSDTDSAIDFGSENLSIDDLDNADAFIIGVNVPMGDFTFDVSYVDGEYDYEGTNTSGDFNEFLITAEYQMSKNFAVTGLYSTYEIDTAPSTTLDGDSASVALEYKF